MAVPGALCSPVSGVTRLLPGPMLGEAAAGEKQPPPFCYWGQLRGAQAVAPLGGLRGLPLPLACHGQLDTFSSMTLVLSEHQCRAVMLGSSARQQPLSTSQGCPVGRVHPPPGLCLARMSGHSSVTGTKWGVGGGDSFGAQGGHGAAGAQPCMELQVPFSPSPTRAHAHRRAHTYAHTCTRTSGTRGLCSAGSRRPCPGSRRGL